jgi:hypothetical protein
LILNCPNFDHIGTPHGSFSCLFLRSGAAVLFVKLVAMLQYEALIFFFCPSLVQIRTSMTVNTYDAHTSPGPHAPRNVVLVRYGFRIGLLAAVGHPGARTAVVCTHGIVPIGSLSVRRGVSESLADLLELDLHRIISRLVRTHDLMGSEWVFALLMAVIYPFTSQKG